MYNSGSYKVTVKRGEEEVTVIHGRIVINVSSLTTGVFGALVILTEQFLESITGFRFHISVDEPERI